MVAGLSVRMETISNSCNAPDMPCLTIKSALERVTNGDAVYVESGHYEMPYAPDTFVAKLKILSGGWNSAFTSQVGLSTLDAYNAAYGCENISINVSETLNFYMDNFELHNCTSSTETAVTVFGTDGIVTLSNVIIRDNTSTDGSGVALHIGPGVKRYVRSCFDSQ